MISDAIMCEPSLASKMQCLNMCFSLCKQISEGVIRVFLKLGAVVPVTKSLRSRVNAKPSNGAEENRDVEVRRSCRIRRSRYSTMNQSVLFDKLITK